MSLKILVVTFASSEKGVVPNHPCVFFSTFEFILDSNDFSFWRMKKDLAAKIQAFFKPFFWPELLGHFFGGTFLQ